jgi:hypothetical protein
MGGTWSTHGRDEKFSKNFDREEQATQKHRYRWKDNIKMDLIEIGREVEEWIHLRTSGRVL